MSVPFPPEWPLDRSLRVEHVWDAFILLSLLNHHNSQGVPLEIPHDGAQKDRFTDAIRFRNGYIQAHGLPDRAHYCTKCVRFWLDADGIPKGMLFSTTIDG